MHTYLVTYKVANDHGSMTGDIVVNTEKPMDAAAIESLRPKLVKIANETPKYANVTQAVILNIFRLEE